MLDDCRGALRLFSRRPSQLAPAILALVIGLAVNFSVFTVIHGVLLTPLPYHQPERIFFVWRTPLDRLPRLQGLIADRMLTRQLATPRMVLEWRRATGSLDDVAALETSDANPSAHVDLVNESSVDRVRAARVTPNFFDLLGVEAQLGRTFSAEDVDGVVISDRLWRSRYAGDLGVVGRPIDVMIGAARERRRVVIIGILPHEIQVTYPDGTDLWSVIGWERIRSMPQNVLAFSVVARLTRGATAASARAELDAIYSNIEASAGISRDASRRTAVRLESHEDYAFGEARRGVAVLTVLTLLLMTVAMLSSSMLLASLTVSRRAEIAARTALGATRVHIARQLFVECSILAGFATLVSIAVAACTRPLLLRWLPDDFPIRDAVAVDGTLVLMMTSLAVFVVAILSTAPCYFAISASRLSAGSMTITSSKLEARCGDVLIAAQIGTVTLLVVGGGLLLRSFMNLQSVDVGFQTRELIVGELRLLSPVYRDQARRRAFEEELLKRVQGLGDVSRVALTSAVPLRGVDLLRSISWPGTPAILVNERLVTPQYFDVMGIPMLSGRGFSNLDTTGAEPVGIISKTLAAAVYGDRDPTGHLMPLDPPVRVVGVVGDVRARQVTEAGMPALYLPRAQRSTDIICVVVRTRTNPALVRRTLPAIVWALDPAQPVERVDTLGAVLDRSISGRRFYASAAVMFAATTLCLALASLAGVVSRSVSERRRELAVRATMGATDGAQILQLVRRAVRPVVAGASIGMIAAAWLATVLKQMLFEVPLIDGPTYTAAGVLILFGAIAVSYWPARRVRTIDIVSALRPQ